MRNHCLEGESVRTSRRPGRCRLEGTVAATVVAPGLLVSRKLAVFRICKLPCLVAVLEVGETDVVVGWLLLAGGATYLCPLATSLASPLALGRS